MNHFQFGERSRKNLNTIIPGMVKVFELGLRLSDIDFGISHGRRTPEEQFGLFKIGRALKSGGNENNPNDWYIKHPKKIVTYTDGYIRKSKHNKDPLSWAGDIYIYIPGKPQMAYDTNHLLRASGFIMAAARILKETGEIDFDVRNGVNWDMDGELVFTDANESFVDLPHFERVD